jgi:hypothetical protein
VKHSVRKQNIAKPTSYATVHTSVQDYVTIINKSSHIKICIKIHSYIAGQENVLNTSMRAMFKEYY